MLTALILQSSCLSLQPVHLYINVLQRRWAKRIHMNRPKAISHETLAQIMTEVEKCHNLLFTIWRAGNLLMSFWFKLEVPHTDEKQKDTVSLRGACSPRNSGASVQGQKVEIPNQTHRHLYFVHFFSLLSTIGCHSLQDGDPANRHKDRSFPEILP